MANDKTISQCGVCFGDINVGEEHDCMDNPTILSRKHCQVCLRYVNINEPHNCMEKPVNLHQHSYKIFKTEEYDDEVFFVYQNCECGSVIKVRPKTTIN